MSIVTTTIPHATRSRHNPPSLYPLCLFDGLIRRSSRCTHIQWSPTPLFVCLFRPFRPPHFSNLIQRYSAPRSIRSSHLFLLALTILLVSTLQAVFLPTATASIYDAKLSPQPAPHVSQDEFTSLATSVLDSIDSISSPAMIISWSLILGGSLLRGAENALQSIASKGRS